MARNHPTPAHLPASTRSPFHHPRRGRACPARALSAAARYCFTHPVSPLHRREGSCPLRGTSRTPPPTEMARNHPAPAHPSATPVGAGHARPATSPPPAVNLPPPTHSPNHLTPQPAFHPPPHNLCPPTAVTPIYTLPKLLPQTLSKKSKKLAKTC